MTARSFRDLRKLIHRLDEQGGSASKFLLHGTLALYRCYDSLYLKRATRPDNKSEKVLIPDHGVLFVGVPKVATRSILMALTSATPAGNRPPIIVELDHETLLRRYPEIETYFRFTFVRSPWSRAVSCYRDKIRNANPIRKTLHLHNRYGLESGMSFDAFAEWLNSAYGSDDVADRHWMSQHRILGYDQPNPITYDFIGRFEDLAEDYQRVRELTDMNLPQLTHRLRTQAPDEYRALYNERNIELIAKRYEKDVDLFGYVFDATQQA